MDCPTASAILQSTPLRERSPVSLFGRRLRVGGAALVDAADGAVYSFDDLAVRATVVRRTLEELGVGAGQVVAWTAPPGVDSIAIWMGTAATGAVDLCISDAVKGPVLDHVLRDSGAAVAIVHDRADAGLATATHEQRAAFDTVVTVGSPPASGSGGGPCIDFNRSFGTAEWSPVEPEPWGLSTITYTSGTTGPSKGVKISHHQLFFVGANFVEQFRIEDDAVLYHYSPYHHITGRQLVVASWLSGAPMVVRDRFSPSRFWDDVDHHGLTHAITLGSAVPLLLHQADAPTSGRTLRRVWASPAMPKVYDQFSQRFSVEVAVPYGSTEVGIVTAPDYGAGPPGNSGRQSPHFQLRIVDDEDQPLPPGHVGEIVVRPEHSWTTFLGYLNRDDATIETNRNLWYHTGDYGSLDADGHLFFADRKQDFIRSKGENISSSEVENALAIHDTVSEVAVVPVPSEFGESDVMAVLVPSSSGAFDAEAFFRWSATQLPYFMVPRYIRTVSDLPRGLSGKVEKYKLRAEGLVPGVWDAAAHGLRAGRAGVGETIR
jgi:crotonobetaine/carnitine-CoA ligase